MTPGQPIYLNFGLHNPACQEAYPTMHGRLVSELDGIITAAANGQIHTFTAERATRLALIATRTTPTEENA